MTSSEMLQILTESGRAVDGGGSTLPPARLLELYEHMLRTRLLDERMINLQRQGRIGFYVPSTGEEAAQVGAGAAVGRSDWLYPSYRMPGTLLMRGAPLAGMVANCFGNASDLCKGRQMPVHYAFGQQRIVSISSPIGTHLIHATGTAMAQRLKRDSGISWAFFGDGGTSSNDFHSGLNFAGVAKAPVVFVCTNNGWAISVPLEKQTASDGIAVKAEAYGMPGVRVDGNDVLAVQQACSQAAERARAGGGPTLVELLTYRRGPHSSSDDPTRYRGNEADSWMSRDPILRFRKFLELQDLWSAEQERALAERLKAEIQAAVTEAEQGAAPAIDSLFSDVYAKVPPHLREQYDELVRNEGTGGEPDPDAAFPL
ncbi:MAG: thiamine pyrophosphate-dependent dehydrogenase E1 component subunit alpha [Planctomycetota bacterium]